jgi:hypothetical protein
VDSFAPEDIRRYYNSAFIRHPHTGKIVQVADVSRENGEIWSSNIDGTEAPRVPKSDVSWDHVKIPRLGYRSLEDWYLYYVLKKTGNLTVKGVHPHNIVIQPNNVLHNMCRQFPYKGATRADAYFSHTMLRRGPIIEEIFNPTFTKFGEALDKLLKGKALGIALSPDFALALGKRADRAITLHFKEWLPAAYSEDGRKWTLAHDGYKDVITRGIKEELNYD